MLDQAHDLRELAQRRNDATALSVGRPTVVAVVGGKGGVGATAVGLNLARTAARDGCRALFIDADPLGEAAALFSGCGESEGPILVDAKVVAAPRQMVRRILDSLDSLEGRLLGAELVVIDVGHASDACAASWRRRADAILMVTTCEAASVVHTFATIRQICAEKGRYLAGEREQNATAAVYLAVNRCPNARAAAIVQCRMAQACRRLLGVELRPAGYLPSVFSSKPKHSFQSFGLNFPALSVDPLRRVLLANVVLN